MSSSLGTVHIKEADNLDAPTREVLLYKIPGDGNCMFSALSFLIYGHIDRSQEIRSRIVKGIVSNWDRYGIFTMCRDGSPYVSAEEYCNEMMQNGVYGTTTELMMAGEIYPDYMFKLYIEGVYTQAFGTGSIEKMISFTGNLTSGHFDVFIEKNVSQLPLLYSNSNKLHSSCTNLFTMTVDNERHFPSSGQINETKSLTFTESQSYIHTSSNESIMTISNRECSLLNSKKVLINDGKSPTFTESQPYCSNVNRTDGLSLITIGNDERINSFTISGHERHSPSDAQINETKSLTFTDSQSYSLNLSNTSSDELLMNISNRECSLPNSKQTLINADESPTFTESQPCSLKYNLRLCKVVLERLSVDNPYVTELTEGYQQNCKRSRGRPKKQITATEKKEKHKEAVLRHQKRKPQSHRKAVQQHTAAHPEIHRQAALKYQHLHPQVHRECVNRYSKTHQDEIRQIRNIPSEVRGLGLTGALKGNDLDKIKPIRLKHSLLCEATYKCIHCGARLFYEEKSRTKWCCGQGKYNVDPLGPLDAQFYAKQHFLKNARAYNNLFSFSALGTTHGFQRPPAGHGPNLVKVQGRIYHRVFDLAYNCSINNTALYIYDGEEHQRLGNQQNLCPNITKEIYEYLKNNNPLIKDLHLLNNHPSTEARLIFQSTSRRTHGPILGDRPASTELAGLIETSNEHHPRAVVIWKIGEAKPHTVPYLHPAYEAFQYPLLFPTAPERYSVDIKDKAGNKLSQVKYYRCQLLSEERFAILRRLSQEYFVDMWCRTEEERLQYFKGIQSELRIATRREIDETIAGEGIRPGKIYLPASLTNSPRYMQIRYHDAMAIVARLGKPSFFLTVTCNPKWPEITESLYPGQQPTDRPDLCVRVFQLKLTILLQKIRSKDFFGTVVSILHVIEFQKRGLPHAHITFRVEGGGPVDSMDIDKFIQATIPPPEQGRLRQLVLQHMVHGPCGSERSLCYDQATRKCSKNFPKSYTEVTHTDERGSVHYKRPAGDQPAISERNQTAVTNRWIVPYNPAILLLMECHCNLEIASTSKVVKYLYKYLHKGPDHARASVTEEVIDEIEHYAQYRYVSASDAMWRLFEFDISCRYPTVVALPVHLPDGDAIIFRAGTEAQASENYMSKLKIYMTRPSDPELDECTYMTFYERYNVETQVRPNSTVQVLAHESGKYFITKRVRGEIVARIVFISPTLGELYFLRMLLLRYPCRSYAELRTVNNIVYDTFQKAAFERGILNDNQEYESAIEEAAGFKTGKGLRQLFFALIMDGAPALLLWDKYRDHLCDDYHRGRESEMEAAYDHGLRDIEQMLRAHGRSLSDFGLPDVRHSITELERETGRWNDESTATLNEWESKLNSQQRAIYNTIVLLAEDDCEDTPPVFIDGPAGTGKTVLLNVIAAKIRCNGHIVLCTASTGIAALNHDGGVTAHSMFKLPLDFEGGNAVWGISNNSQRAALIKAAKLIIVDEAPMAHRYLFETIDRGLKDLMKCSNRSFGGKVLVFAGDFRQIPPVITGAGERDICRASIKSSDIWRYIQEFKLTENQRAKEDPNFANFLLSVGEGEAETIEEHLLILKNINYVNSLQQLIDDIYPQHEVFDAENLCKRAILSGTNENIRDINQKILELIPGPIIICYSADTTNHLNDNSPERLEGSVLNSFTAPGVPDYDLKLKVGAVVLLIRNISFTHRLVNGTKLVIDHISKFTLLAHHPNSNELIVIPRITFKFQIGRNGIEMTRKQFPVKLAYAMTFNKSQGQTLDRVGVDLRSDVFSHGQLYVALGRVRHSHNLCVLVPPERVTRNYALTKNIVYKSLL